MSAAREFPVEQSFIKSGRVRLVQGGKKREELRAEKADQQTNASASSMKKFGLEQGADYILQGSINSIIDSQKRKKVVYYQINLELTNIQIYDFDHTRQEMAADGVNFAGLR